MVRECVWVLWAAMLLAAPAAWGEDLIADTPALQKKQREEMNAKRVGIVTGGTGGTYIKLGADLADVVEDTVPGLKLVVMRGRGSARNLQELVFLEYTDLAFVQADVLESIAREDPDDYAYLHPRIAYVARFHPEVIHVLGMSGLVAPADLDGKRVAIDLPGSGTRITAPLVLEKLLGVRPEFVAMRPADALKDLLSDQPSIAAMVYVAGRGTALFKNLSDRDIRAVREKKLGFIPFAAPPPADTPYATTTLTSKDYVGLIASGAGIPAWTVPAVLAVYDWKPGLAGHRDRYRRIKTFIDAFFAQRSRLDDGPGGFDENWCSIDLAQEVAGWKRFSYATEWLRAHAGEQTAICAPAAPSCQELFERDMRNAGLDPAKPEVRQNFEDWRRSKGQSCT